MNKIIIPTLILLASTLSACGGSSSETPAPEPVTPAPKSTENTATLESYTWSFDAGSAIKSTAALSEASVFFATDKGIVYGLNTSDGSQMWQRDIGSKVSGTLLYAENTVLFLSIDGVFHALNAENGDTRWNVATAGESLMDQWDYHTNSAIFQNNTVYFASKSGVVYALNISDGSEIWSYNLNEKLRGIPYINDETLYVSSETGIFSINITDGSENWYKSSQMPSSPVIDSGVLAVGSRSGLITGYNANTGQKVWSLSHGTSWVTGEALAHNGAFYIGSSDDTKFESIDAKTGELNWSVGSGKNVFSKPLIANDIIYMTSADAYSSPGAGYIKAFDLAGTPLWSLAGSNFTGSVVNNETSLFIGSDDGFFYAISLTQE